MFVYCFLFMALNYVIAIAGASGSGKTALRKRLVKESSVPICELPIDHYYRDQTDIPKSVREKTNYDEPAAIDAGLFSQHVKALRRGEPISRPTYDFNEHTRNGTVLVEPKPFVIIEGIFALHPEIYQEEGLYDLGIFVNTPERTCVARRFRRDTVERGRSAESVYEQLVTTVFPGYDHHVAPTREHADFQIYWDGNMDNVVENLKHLVAGVSCRRELEKQLQMLDE
ncbi:uridine kinase [Candidatus Woesearchaeota archaeon]|nr:uridine kinase [Candidatus Woesearchaeota archaeon]